MARLTRIVDGERRFISEPPVLVRLDELVSPDEAQRFKGEVNKLLRSYRASLPDDRRVLVERYRFADVARKVVGVGSVGTRAWVVLMLGRDPEGSAAAAVQGGSGIGAGAVPRRQPVPAPRPARRGGPAPDAGRQRHPARLAADARLRRRGPRLLRPAAVGQEGLGRGRDDDVTRACCCTARCARWTLARAHARSGDSVALAAYLGRSDTFDRAMAEFAEGYADQNERDHATLRQAIADGVVTATVGV